MNIIEESFKTITPVPDNVHMIFKNLFKQYILVGGFPDAIVSFMKNHNAIESYRKNEKIIFDMKSDFGRRKGRDGNAKSSKTVMSHPEHYGVTKLIKIGDYNIGKKMTY